jgi:acetyl-CoA C-acetyltransferase
VDQAAAVLLCSYEVARAGGVPDERMVFFLAGADAHDHYWFSERHHLSEAPAVGIATRAALAAAGTTVDDIARFDLYSCFPSAVQMTMGALGLAGPAGGDARRRCC